MPEYYRSQAAQRHSGAVRNGETAPTSKRRRVESEPEAQCGHPAAVAAENSSDDEWMPNVWDLLKYNRGRPKKTSKRQAPVRRRQAGKTAESSSDDEYDHHHRSSGCCAPQVLGEFCGGAVRQYLCGKCGKEWWSRTPVEDAMCPVCLRGHWCGKCTMDRLMRQQPQRLQRAIDAGEVAAAIHHHQTESSSDDEYDHHHRSCGCCAPQVLEEVRVRRYLCRRCGEMWWSASRPWCRNCALSFYAMLPKEV